MRKLILIVLAVLLLIPNIPVSAEGLPVPEQITKAGKIYKLNMAIVEEKGYAVYGDHKDVPNNQLKEGHYRYLGYDLNGNPFTNIDFPNDADSGKTDAERDWIKQPWLYPGSTGKPLEDGKSKINDDPQAAEWLDSLNIGGGWTGEKLVDYFNIQSPPGDYYPGQAAGWHKGSTGNWYKSFIIPPMMLIGLEPEEAGQEDFEFTVNHYEQGTTNDVFRPDYIRNPNSPVEVYAKSGIGLDGNEWICTVVSPQVVEIVNGGEYNFYYTKKPKEAVSGEGQLVLVKDPLVTANCKIAGRKNIPDTKGGKYPDGMPLFRGDQFRPTGTIKNPNGREVFIEYSMKLKDKPDKNFRQINSKTGEGITAAGGTLTDSFSKKISSSDRYGNVYVLTVDAKQRIIVPEPPLKPGPKPTKPTKPDRDDYDSYSDYKHDRDDYYDDLEDYYDDLEEWYERRGAWDAYIEKWGDPDSGEVFKYKTYNGRDIWFSEKYDWRNGTSDDANVVMLNIKTDIEDMDGGTKPSTIVE